MKSNSLSDKRWWVIILGLFVQGSILAFVIGSLAQPGQPDVTFAPVGGNPTLCRIVTVAPFTEAWINGIRPGMVVRSDTTTNLPGPFHEIGNLVNCRPTAQSIRMRIIDQQSTLILILNTEPGSMRPISLLLAGLLAVVFSLTGITIYLRAADRPVAHAAYVLFYLAALDFCLLNIHGYVWINVLLSLLSIITYGAATTFVCLLPHRRHKSPTPMKLKMAIYSPFVVALLLTVISLPVTIWYPQTRTIVAITDTTYTLICMATALGVVFWGMRRLREDERHIFRMVIIGVVFLFLPMALNQSAQRYSSQVVNSAAHLFTIPLLILPIVCAYALVRHQFLGMTSLFSRRAMRVLLWLLLASFFIVTTIMLQHSIESSVTNAEVRDYCYAGLFVLNLWFFPMAWSKIRDLGDQVFYGDFYQYNRSLRDISAKLTELQHLDQICTFVLPQLTTLLNATGAALLVRTRAGLTSTGSEVTISNLSSPWSIYQDAPQLFLPKDQLIGVANLALTHLRQPSLEPLLLDGVLLLALYDGDALSGFLCLGPKLNSEPYSRQDKSFLATLAAQLSLLEVNSRYLEKAEADAQKLTALNHRVISAQEEERHHLALELHDEVLQQAMLLVRQLSDASTMAEVGEAMPLARSLVLSLRRTCLELRPPLLDELGLEEALHWLARQTEQRGELDVRVSSVGASTTRPSPHVELALYRVVQEALSNVLKHAGASRVLIRLRYGRYDAVSLLVWDNGRGFQTGKFVTGSLGLVGMHERMTAVGGHLRIRTHPGRGTLIRAVYAVPAAVAPSQAARQEEGTEEVPLEKVKHEQTA